MNEAGETALDIARKKQHKECEELLEQAQAGTLAFPLHVDYNWGISPEPGSDSEEDEEEKVGPGPVFRAFVSPWKEPDWAWEGEGQG